MSLTTQAFGHDGKTYNGKDLRQLLLTIFPFPTTGGFVSDFHAQQQGSPNATVSVQLGTAIIPASGAGLTGMYEVWNDAALTSPAFTATTTNGRKDRLILRVTAGVPALEIVQGTASGTPAEPAITGDNYLEIALITLPGSTTNITNAMITDRRVPIGAVGGVIAAATGLLPAYEPWQGTLAYDTTTGMFKVKRSGAAWQGFANVMVCTNATRPTGIGEGFIIYETDTLLLFIRTASGWCQITPESATVATNQSTTSSTFVDLATVGPTVTVETGTKAIVDLSCDMDCVGAGIIGWMGFAISGESTVAASANSSLKINVSSGAGWPESGSRRIYLSGLTPGVNVFTAKYLDYTGGGTGAKFFDRSITVTPLPS